MTALSDYERLEATALWRPEGESQRREVIVSLGNATLTIADMANQPVAHWSLPAITRINGTNEKTAIFSASSESDERLEIEDETMIAAIAKIRRAIERGRSHPGRLRGAIAAGLAVALGGLAVFWLPNALIRQATTIVPEVTRAAIGTQMFERLTRLSGQPCGTKAGDSAAAALNTRLRPAAMAPLYIVDSGVPTTQHLPGGALLVNRTLVEDYAQPEVVAGFILAEEERAAQFDPLERLLKASGLMTTLRLLTTGEIPAAAIDAHAEALLTAPPAGIAEIDPLIARFIAAEVPLSPYAYALDITGAATLPLIEADAVHIQTRSQILDPAQWQALQSICQGN